MGSSCHTSALSTRAIAGAIRFGTWLSGPKKGGSVGVLSDSSADASLFESIDQALLEVDDSLRVISYNGPFRDTFLQAAGLEPGTPLMEVFSDKLLQTIVRLGFDSDEPVPDAGLSWTGADGNSSDFLVSLSRPNSSGLRVVLAFHDVTAWLHRQRELAKTSRMEALRDTIAGMAHEINNPLGAILCLSQLALKQGPAPNIRRDLEGILDQASNASQVMSNLQLGASGLRPRNELVDIVQVLQGVVNMKTDWFRSRGIPLTASTPKRPVVVQGDGDQLRQAFTNIVTNAQQAMAEADSGGTFAIEVDAASDRARLSFRDGGQGIEPEDLPRIFDPFFTTRDVGQGTGLGLTVCQRIVANHGGEIRAESRPEDGTTVIVELPLVDVSRAADPGEQSLPGGNPSRALKILVVEDEPLVADVMMRSLIQHGHQVDWASSGTEVVGWEGLQTYDLVLLDVKMPGIGGVAVFDHLRTVSEDIVSKVVIVTGDVASIETQEFIQRSGSPVLAKPFTLEQLIEVVDRFT